MKLDQKTIPSLDDLEDCLNEIKKEYSKNLTKKLAMVNTTSNAYTCSASKLFLNYLFTCLCIFFCRNNF